MQRTMDIEDLLGWTYRAQLADIVIERGYGPHPIEKMADGIPVFRASADGVVACMRSGALGTSAIGGAASVKADLHVDAERVHKTVMMMGGEDAMLAIRHAKAANRPDWLPDARHRFEPKWKGNRKFDAVTGLPVKGSYDVIRDADRYPAAAMPRLRSTTSCPRTKAAPTRSIIFNRFASPTTPRKPGTTTPGRGRGVGFPPPLAA